MKFIILLITIFFMNHSTFLLSDERLRSNRPELSTNLAFPTTKESKNIVRLISYNIRGDSLIDRENGNSWDIRKYKIQYLMQHYQPDIIGLQGVSKCYMPDIEDLFSEYTCIAFDISEKSKDVALLVRTKRFSIIKQHYFWLAQEPFQEKIPAPSWDARSPRIVVYAILDDQYTGKTSALFCTHFDSSGPESWIKSAQLLGQQQKHIACDMPVIIMGDFNFIVTTDIITQKSSAAYAEFINNTGLHDVRDFAQSIHYGPDGSWIGWPYDTYAAPAGTIGERLDTIFVRQCNVLKEGVLNLKVNNNFDGLLLPSDEVFDKAAYSSDHLPVIADIMQQ